MTRRVEMTVAIATLNRPENLGACLDAVLRGRVLPAQVVVVDQSDDDRTRLEVERRGERGVSTTYMHQRQRGLSASRNAAIAAATRPIIAFTDDDCAPDAGWLEAVDRAFATSAPLDAVTGQVLPCGPDDAQHFAVSPRESAARTDFRGRHIPWIVGTGGNFVIRRGWFDRIGPFDARLGAGSPGRAAEDADVIDRVLARGGRIRFEPDAIVYHRRQTRNQRLASRWGYGHGIGALCALRLRQGDMFAAWALTRWFSSVVRELLGTCVRCDWFGAYQRLLGLGGTLGGLVYGFRVPG